jgi:hypothetical protein
MPAMWRAVFAAKAAEWRYECTERGCRKPRGAYHRLGPQSADHEELWFLTQTPHGVSWNPPGSLSPAARSITKKEIEK